MGLQFGKCLICGGRQTAARRNLAYCSARDSAVKRLAIAAYLIACISVVSGALSRFNSATTSRPSASSPRISSSGPAVQARTAPPAVELKGHYLHARPEDFRVRDDPLLQVGALLQPGIREADRLSRHGGRSYDGKEQFVSHLW